MNQATLHEQGEESEKVARSEVSLLPLGAPRAALAWAEAALRARAAVSAAFLPLVFLPSGAERATRETAHIDKNVSSPQRGYFLRRSSLVRKDRENIKRCSQFQMRLWAPRRGSRDNSGLVTPSQALPASLSQTWGLEWPVRGWWGLDHASSGAAATRALLSSVCTVQMPGRADGPQVSPGLRGQDRTSSSPLALPLSLLEGWSAPSLPAPHPPQVVAAPHVLAGRSLAESEQGFGCQSPRPDGGLGRLPLPVPQTSPEAGRGLVGGVLAQSREAGAVVGPCAAMSRLRGGPMCSPPGPRKVATLMATR